MHNKGDVNSNCKTAATAISFKWFSALNQVLHTDIFRTVSKIGMYCLLCFWPIHFWTCLSGGFQVYPLYKWQLV